MSLTLPNEYSYKIALGNIIENWVIRLYYDTESSYFPIAIHTTSLDSDYYRGIVKNKLSVRNDMDLKDSTSKYGNITIEIFNDSYNGSDLSKEFLGGVHKYINRKVEVKSLLPGITQWADCAWIGTFRINDISHNTDTIILSCAEYRITNFISIPNIKIRNNIYVPVAYGAYTRNISAEGAESYCNSYALRPAPVIDQSGGQFRTVIGEEDAPIYANLHIYDKNIDRFVNIKDTDTASYLGGNLEDYASSYIVNAPRELRYSVKVKPQSTFIYSPSWINPSLAYDFPSADDTTTYAYNQKENIYEPFDSGWLYMYFRIPDLFLEADSTGAYEIIADVTWEIVVTTYTAGSQAHIVISGGPEYYDPGSYLVDWEGEVDGEGTFSGIGTVDLIQSTDPNFMVLVRFQKFIEGLFSGTARIKDVRFRVSADIDWTDEKSAKATARNIDKLYTSADGLTESWTGSSNPITKIHEAHRDMLIRYAGHVTTTPYNWSANLNINSIKDWGIRFWLLEPEPLEAVLEKLQYEGGFIFRWRADGSASYWCIKDSYTSSDVSATLTEKDIKDIKIYNSPFSDLLTKMDINYVKHAGTNGYITTISPYSDTTRTAWNIKTKENIAKVGLDAYVSPVIPAYDDSTDVESSSPNDDFYAYYHNISGKIRIIVDCVTVNPKYYNLECGDIVKFDYNIVTPFNYSWSDKYFMITTLARSPGSLKMTCEEVYSV